QPTVRVALVPGTQDWLCRLICHVTGFYPRNIEVIWERGGQVVHGEQLTSGILPNGDLTFQIQVSIELGQEGVGPAEHVCVVRHSSLGHDPLRVTWDPQVTGQAGVPAIIAGCILAALGVVALGWYLMRRPGGPRRGHIARHRHSQGLSTLLQPQLSQQETPCSQHLLAQMPPSDQTQSRLCQGHRI
ncbi:unnamed protein product, partial [Lepidochelys kempii]